jgi:hypothetical protein
MREAIREIVADLPDAILTAAAIAAFEAVAIGILIILATPVPA